MNRDVRLLSTPLDPANELARFAAAHPQSGGIASFIGQVRAESGNAAVLELELSHYPPLTLPEMAALIDSFDSELGEALLSPKVRVAVNGALGVTALSDGDEVAFLPPVSGG